MAIIEEAKEDLENGGVRKFCAYQDMVLLKIKRPQSIYEISLLALYNFVICNCRAKL